jgi:hypothetical protein
MLKISEDEIIYVEVMDKNKNKCMIKTNNELLNYLKTKEQENEIIISLYQAHPKAENKLFEIIKNSNAISTIDFCNYRLLGSKYSDPVIPNKIMRDMIGENKSIQILKLQWIDRIDWNILQETIKNNATI